MLNLTVFLAIYNQLQKKQKKRIVPESEAYGDAYFRNKTKDSLMLSEKRFNDCRDDLINAYKSQCFTSIEKMEKLYDAAVYDLINCQANNATSHAWYRDFKTKRGSSKYFDRVWDELWNAHQDSYIKQLRTEFDDRFPSKSRNEHLSNLRFELLEAY